MSLGARLKKEREHKGWSQIYVAQKLGITNSVLSNYERDYRDPDTKMLTKLAELYEVTTDYLLGHSVSRAPDAGRAFYGGGKDWTPEELEAADAYIEMLRQKKRERQDREKL